MSFIKPKPPVPVVAPSAPVVAPPKKSDSEVAAAEADALKRARNASGMSSTILTSGLGVTSPATTAKSSLLGY